MLFTSPVFLFVFLPITFLANVLFPKRFRNLCILAASIIFYVGEKTFVLLLVGSIAFNYIFGKWLENIEVQRIRYRNFVLSLALIFNLGLLGYFKYANFFVIEILSVDVANWSNVALPLGISFYTFQCLSYVLDIYWGKIKSSPDIITFGAYISSFPQLIAGPIVRYEEIQSSLLDRTINADEVCEGCRRFALGLGKKMLLANPMGYVADKIYQMPLECLDAPHAWLAILCYSLQIYYDFSGYSDMAIGLGKMIGFNYPENFNYPYAASSVRDFWRRWHMTLTRWFRDYVYIPMGGNRISPLRTAINKWTIFLFCGLWHGASWNFIIWGAYHGFFMVFEGVVPKRITKFFPPIAGYFYAMLIVSLGWVIFRSETMAQALSIYKAAFGFADPTPYAWSLDRFWRGDIILPLIIAIAGCFPFVPWIEKMLSRILGQTLTDIGRYSVLLAVFIISCAFTFSDLFNPFLYFRF